MILNLENIEIYRYKAKIIEKNTKYLKSIVHVQDIDKISDIFEIQQNNIRFIQDIKGEMADIFYICKLNMYLKY